ncbi:MAG: penicillin-insensitive murein endopeptidase, partial [Pseudomonadota bacterium]
MLSRVPFLLAGFLFSLPSLAFAYRYTHEVLPGEFLLDISRRYRISVSELRRLNGIKSNNVRAGQKLKIVTSTPSKPRYKVQYRVRAGDSFWKIAKKHRMKVSVLRRLNQKVFKGPLQVGSLIWVVVEGTFPKGAVSGLFQLKDGPGFVVRDPQKAWGTWLTISRIYDVLVKYKKRFPDAEPVMIFDLSKKRGGYLPPHRSHRLGRDVDIPYMRKNEHGDRRFSTPKTMDLERSWFLINE